jgi:hypothetical protein
MDHGLLIFRVLCKDQNQQKDRNQQDNHEMAMDSNSMTMNFKWI